VGTDTLEHWNLWQVVYIGSLQQVVIVHGCVVAKLESWRGALALAAGKSF